MSRRATYGLQALVLRTTIPILVLITVASGVLIYRELYQTILAGFDGKLVAVSTITAAFIDGDKHQEMAARLREPDFDAAAMEASREFLDTVEPMREIKAKLDLTYLYSQKVTGVLDIVYLFDANTDDNHSPPGYADTMPEDDADNIRKVVTDGVVHLTPIQAWEQWGLIKTAFSPIRDSAGQPVAMAGADVDITSIQRRTRIALVNVGVVGGLSLLIGTAIAYAIAVRLAAPMRKLKYAGFEVSAGKFGLQVEPTGPTELRALAHGFNRMSATLRERLETLRQTDRRTEEERREREIIRLLQEEPPGKGPVRADGRLDRSGRTLWWWVDLPEDPLAAAVERRSWRALLARMLPEEPGGPGLPHALPALLGPELRGLVLLDGGMLHVATVRPLVLERDGSRPDVLTGRATVALSPGQAWRIHPAGDGA